MKRCLIVFAKEPQKDRVKTRLSSCLSGAKRLSLYKAFLKDTIELTKNVKCEEKILAYESGDKDPKYLKSIAPTFKFYKQKGRNLGEKMHNAFKFAEKNKAIKAVIIGSDSPTLPAGFIIKAFRMLNRKDVVLGPSYDGGYYLIGLKKPCSGLFKGIRWSTNSVLNDTIAKSKVLKKKTSFLDIWYDVDSPDTLPCLTRDLKKDKNIAKWTRRFLKI